MTICFLGQSGYIIKTKKAEIVIDPYLSDSVNRVAGRPRLLPIPIKPSEIYCDAVVCTHDHLDHLDPETISDINNDQLFITTKEGKEKILSLGKHNVKSLSLGESLTIGDVDITAVLQTIPSKLLVL